MSVLVERGLTVRELAATQGRIIVALMLRDIKTRFGSGPKFFVAILWPLSHSFIILAINTAVGRTVPYGENGALWFATGLVPYMAFSYMSRFTMLGLVMDRPLLVFPIVKGADLLFARATLELLNASVVVMLTMLIFVVLGIDFTPLDFVQACYALGASMLLGFGFGILNGVIAGLMVPWVTGYAICQILMWIASGILFVPDALPETVRYWLSFNPALQGVEWMRSAYYDGYGTGVLDRNYMIGFALVSLLLGLGLDRCARGKILS